MQHLFVKLLLKAIPGILTIGALGIAAYLFFPSEEDLEKGDSIEDIGLSNTEDAMVDSSSSSTLADVPDDDLNPNLIEVEDRRLSAMIKKDETILLALQELEELHHRGVSVLNLSQLLKEVADRLRPVVKSVITEKPNNTNSIDMTRAELEGFLGKFAYHHDPHTAELAGALLTHPASASDISAHIREENRFVFEQLKDKTELGRQYLKTAANSGKFNAAFNLGLTYLYRTGKDWPWRLEFEDRDEAIKWFQKALTLNADEEETRRCLANIGLCRYLDVGDYHHVYFKLKRAENRAKSPFQNNNLKERFSLSKSDLDDKFQGDGIVERVVIGHFKRKAAAAAANAKEAIDNSGIIHKGAALINNAQDALDERLPISKEGLWKKREAAEVALRAAIRSGDIDSKIYLGKLLRDPSMNRQDQAGLARQKSTKLLNEVINDPSASQKSRTLARNILNGRHEITIER